VTRRFLRHDEGRLDVKRDHPVERRLVDFEEGLRPVDPALLTRMSRRGRPAIAPRAASLSVTVERQRPRPPASRLDFRRHSRKARRCAAVEQQFGPGPGERQPDRAADPAPRRR